MSTRDSTVARTGFRRARNTASIDDLISEDLKHILKYDRVSCVALKSSESIENPNDGLEILQCFPIKGPLYLFKTRTSKFPSLS